MKKKMLSVLLCLCMVCTLLPATALATDGEHPHSSHTCNESCDHHENDPHRSVSMSAWDSQANSNYTTTLPTSGSYYLTADVTLTELWTPTGDTKLCLNGHTITISNYIQLNESVALTITDCGSTGKIKRNGGTGTGVYVTGGTFNLYGGSITGCTKGVSMNYGTIHLYGGRITGCTTGVDMAYSGTFDMSGGSITGNSGTGVYMSGGTFNMSGGSITGNTVAGDYASGGGVYMSGAGATFNMSGGRITGNSVAGTQSSGGGVYVNGTMTVSGNVTISGNTNNSASVNVYLLDGKTITVGGALSNTASIGVTTATEPTAGSPVDIATGSNVDKNCFTSDKDGFDIDKVVEEDTATLQLVKLHAHSWSFSYDDSTKTITATCGANDCPLSSSRPTYSINVANNTPFTPGYICPVTRGTASAEWTSASLADPAVTDNGLNSDLTDGLKGTATLTVGNAEVTDGTVNYTLQKGTLATSDFTFTAPNDLTYDGTGKGKDCVQPNNDISSYITSMSIFYWEESTPGTSSKNLPVNAGTYCAKINADGTPYYTPLMNLREEDWKFTIAQKNLANDDVTVADIPDQTYTGSAIQPEPTVTYNNMTLVKDTDYTLSYGDNTNVGTGSITITAVADSNYTGFKTVDFNIVAMPGQVTISGNLNVTYGTEIPNVTIDKHGSNGTTTVYYYTNEACTTGETTTKPTTAGDYWVKVKMDAAGNYGADESNVLSFTIARADITPSVSIANWTYGSSASTPSVTGNTGNGSVTYKYKVKDANDDTYTTTVPTDAGDYTIKATVEQTTNYNGGSATTDFQISPKDISGVTIADIAAQTYNNGAAITPTPAVQDGNTTLTVVTDFTYDYENNINVGDNAAVKVLGQGNYTGTASKNFTISRADLTITVNITGWVVNGTPNDPTVTGNAGNGDVSYQYKVKGADDNTYTTTVPTAVGDYTVKATVEQTTNYNAATATADFAISTKAVQTITAENVTVTYRDSNKAVSGTTSGDGTISYTVKSGDEYVEVNSSTGALTIKKVGTATITVAASETNSYAAASKDITVTVDPLAVTEPTADTTVFTYNGQNQTYGVTETVNYTVSNGIQKNAGNYTVTVALKDKVNTVWADSNNTTDKTFGFEIKKATITIAAKNKSAYVNDTAPTLGEGDYTVSGLASGESLKTPPTIAYASAPDMTKTGTASITVSGAEAPDGGNYNDIIYNNGTLTISTKPSGGGGGYTPPTYKVESEVAEQTDGSVSLSTGSAKKGDTVTITVTPDTYYQVEEVIVKDSNGKIIEVTENEDGTFSFEMPASKVTVEPVFSWDNPFTDVSEDAYYTPAVEWALKNDITNGTSATTFSPAASCTRAQMATFLWRAAGSPDPVGSSNPFADISEDAYYAKAVQWAYEQGITGGTSDTTFSPDAACTRAQMVTFLHRVADTQKPEGNTNPFTDVPDAYYTEAVQWAYEQSITGGTSATTFSPDAICARGQMVTFLYRFFVK